jgi:hypothetical protein
LSLKTGYITDDFSTLGGLAAVAYGDVDSFREVQNQIISNSPTRGFDNQRPSDLFRSFLPSEDLFVSEILNSFKREQEENEEFSDYLDEALGANWEKEIERSFLNEFYYQVDNEVEYGNTLNVFLEKTLGQLFIGYHDLNSLASRAIDDLTNNPVFSEDLEFIAKISSNNPRNKISSPPPNSNVPLTNSIDLDKDFRDLPFSTSYLLPQDYYSEVAYPGFGDITSIPLSLRDSVENGYVGYPNNLSLESIFNPIGAESLREISSSIGNILSGSDIWNTTSVLGQLEDIPGLSQADKDIYEISLMGARINGFLEFDPATQSNGDYFDTSLLPEILNSDKDNGVPLSSRKFSNTF